ncbi:MAG TPA: ABC transporter permease [Thermomicrobiales bacterium]|nr:ABC transporter permease [Thermomicrobiales bacterium]
MSMQEGHVIGLGDAVVDRSPDELEPERASRIPIPNGLRILWENRKSRTGLIILGLIALMGIFAPLIAPYDPHDTSFLPLENATREHWLGTTQAGEDILSQLIYGARTSLIVGILAGGLATIIGLIIGMIAGYAGGWTDEILSFLINLALVVPTLPLMITIAAYSPVKGVITVIAVIGFTGWAWGARMKRSQIITLRERDYITASIFAGEPMWRIVFREIMPNMTSLIVAGYIGAAGAAIGAEAGLAFIGVGDPNTISWGTMLYWANNSGALLTGQWGWLFPPGLALALLITSLTLINFGVDAISNPHLREE